MRKWCDIIHVSYLLSFSRDDFVGWHFFSVVAMTEALGSEMCEFAIQKKNISTKKC